MQNCIGKLNVYLCLLDALLMGLRTVDVAHNKIFLAYCVAPRLVFIYTRI